MQSIRVRLLLLAATVCLFGLQFFAHFTTRFRLIFDQAMPLVVVAALLASMLGASIAAIMWFSLHDRAFKQQPRTWCIACSLFFAIGITMTIASAVYGRGFPTGSFARRFDSDIWSCKEAVDGVGGCIPYRQQMLADAVMRIVEGNTKQGIVAQLGPPDADRSPVSGRELTYCTGPQRDSLFPIDREWLSIRFDDNDQVDGFDIWSD